MVSCNQRGSDSVNLLYIGLNNLFSGQINGVLGNERAGLHICIGH